MARARAEIEPRGSLSLAEVREELLAALCEHERREPRTRRRGRSPIGTGAWLPYTRWTDWEERRLALLEAHEALRRLDLLEACTRLWREGHLAEGAALTLLDFLLLAEPEPGLQALNAARAERGLAPLAWRGEWLALAEARVPWGGA